MASIQKRELANGEVRFKAIIRLKGHPTESAMFNSRSAAKVWAQSTEAAIREGRHQKKNEAKKHTLTEAIDRWQTDNLPRFKDTAKPAVHLKWWTEKIGSTSLADVTTPLIIEMRGLLLRKGLSPSTANRYTTTLSRVLSVCVREWGWLERSPMVRFPKLKEPRGRDRFLSDDERIRLLESCKQSLNPDLYTAVVLSLSTGARRSEIWGLHWPQIDLAREAITLHETKNDEKRVLPIKGQALELIREKSRIRSLETDLLFPSSTDPQIPMDFKRAWLNALKRAEIEDFRWHDLRHSAASYLAMSGATPSEIAAVLGHKTLQMVKRYAHLSDEHNAELVERMNRKFVGGNNAR